MSGHKWIPSTLGHGDLMCEHCRMTSAEARVLGEFDKPCPRARTPVEQATPFPAVEAEVERLIDAARKDLIWAKSAGCEGDFDTDDWTDAYGVKILDALTRLASDRTRMEGWLDAAQVEIGSRALDLQLSNARAEDAEAERVTLSAQIAALEQSNTILGEKVQRAEAERDALKKQAEEFSAMKEELDSEIEALRLAILGGEDAPGAAMSWPVDVVLDAHQTNLANSHARAERAEADLSALKQRVAEVEAEKADLVEKRRALKAEITAKDRKLRAGRERPLFISAKDRP